MRIRYTGAAKNFWGAVNGLRRMKKRFYGDHRAGVRRLGDQASPKRESPPTDPPSAERPGRGQRLYGGKGPAGCRNPISRRRCATRCLSEAAPDRPFPACPKFKDGYGPDCPARQTWGSWEKMLRSPAIERDGQNTDVLWCPCCDS
jgi:hypothetical protein